MSKSNWDGWNEAIKNMEMNKREPVWDQAIKHLVSEGAMEPTMYDTLTQGQIQEIMLESDEINIHDLFISFGKWLISSWGEVRFYVCRFTTGNELWLAYLMSVYYAMEWNGEKWRSIA